MNDATLAGYFQDSFPVGPPFSGWQNASPWSAAQSGRMCTLDSVLIGFQSEMNVSVIVSPSCQHLRRVESVVSLVNGCQRHYRLEVIRDDSLNVTKSLVRADNIAEGLEKKYPSSHLIAITEDAFNDNWFSHEYRYSCVITVFDWESLYAPPSLRAYLTYQVAQALMHFSAEMSEEIAMNIVHEPPVGCIYDLSVEKKNIKLGMVAGNVCHQCVGQLRALGTPEAAIDSVVKIVSLVRSEALGRPIPFDPSEAFVVMRFTTNDENDNAWKYGLKPGIESCGLRASRGDDRVESRHILDKVDSAIRRSRLIVAKVDENNLNVYYELGLAMGLEKDVLLVSEASLAINLPSDLRSWECLTYERGNYSQLAERVKKFLVEQYRVTAGV